jgi:hypothetical protein
MNKKLLISLTTMRFEDGLNYFQIDKEKCLLTYKIKQLGISESTSKVSMDGLTFHIGINGTHSIGREIAGIYIEKNQKDRTQIANFKNALTLNYIINNWLENEKPDIESLNEMFVAGCKPVPFVRIWLSIGIIVGVINLIG